MGAALEWFRMEVCRKEGHDHGEAGEADCLVVTYAKLKEGAGAVQGP